MPSADELAELELRAQHTSKEAGWPDWCPACHLRAPCTVIELLDTIAELRREVAQLRRIAEAARALRAATKDEWEWLCTNTDHPKCRAGRALVAALDASETYREKDGEQDG